MKIPDSLRAHLPPHSLLVGFDTETTGLNGQIVELSFWCGDAEFTRRCRPTCGMHPRAERAHGIPLAALEGERPFEAIAAECSAFLVALMGRSGARQLVVVGHNVSFDLRILRQEVLRTGVGLLPACACFSLCTLELARRRRRFLQETFPEGETFNLKLGSLFFAVTGRRLEGAHSAAADARASVLLLLSGVLTVGVDGGFVRRIPA